MPIAHEGDRRREEGLLARACRASVWWSGVPVGQPGRGLSSEPPGVLGELGPLMETPGTLRQEESIASLSARQRELHGGRQAAFRSASFSLWLGQGPDLVVASELPPRVLAKADAPTCQRLHDVKGTTI